MRLSIVTLCTALGVQQAISSPVHSQNQVPTVISAKNVTAPAVTFVQPAQKMFIKQVVAVAEMIHLAHLFEGMLPHAFPLGRALAQSSTPSSAPPPTSNSLSSPTSSPLLAKRTTPDRVPLRRSPLGTGLADLFSFFPVESIDDRPHHKSSKTSSQAPSSTSVFLPVYTKVDRHALAAERKFPTLLSKASEIPGYDLVKGHPGLVQNASKAALHFQPVMDFKVNSCYNAAATTKNGIMNPGLEAKQASLADDCRNPLSLTPDYNNVYVRRRCNHGWCAWMYDYYFPKDVMSAHSNLMSGHKHEWEFVIVWTNIKPTVLKGKQGFNGSDGFDWQEVSTQEGNFRDSLLHGRIPKLENWAPKHVSLSYHRGASSFDYNRMLWQNGTHPKIVYTKQGIVTHIVRPAGHQDHTIWNASGKWVRGSLVEWDGIATPKIRSKMCEKGAWGDASPSIGPDDQFARKLERAIPDAIRDDGFNSTYDVYDKLPQFADLS